VKQHISSLGEYFDKAKDVITLIEAGFIGKYGEWFYANKEFGSCEKPLYPSRAEVLKLLLETVPIEIPIALRAPTYRTNILALWKANQLPQDKINLFTARLGFFNDCFLDNDTDQNTFLVPQERDYLKTVTTDLPMVGESCTSAIMINPLADWKNAEEQLRKQHWSLLSADDNGRFWTPDTFCTNKKPALTVRCSRDKDCKKARNAYHSQDGRINNLRYCGESSAIAYI
jgi:hypothetical protein